MPSGLAESPNSVGGSSGGNFFGGSFNSNPDGGGSYDAMNDDVFHNSGSYNVPGGSSNSGDFSNYDFSTPSIGDFGNTFGDFGNTYGDFGGTYDAMSPSFSYNNIGFVNTPATPVGWDGTMGDLNFQKYSVDALDAANAYEAPSSFWDSEFGKNLRKMGLFALRVHPATRTPMAIYGALNDLSSGRIGQGIGGLVGTATGNPGLAGLFGLGVDAARGQPVNSQLGSRIGGMAGAYTNGPVGAALGSMVGQRIGQGMDAGQGRPAASKEGSGTGSGDVLGAGLTSLAALYMANRQRQTAQQQQQQQLQQAQTLQDMFAQQQAQAPKAPAMRQPNLGGIGAKMEAMFGANSQTAQTLRKQLERKDAAAGRRSQYGPREVELLARLSQLRAQAEPGYMNAEIAAANAANQHAAQMFSTQQQAYNNYIQNMMRGQQLGGINQSSAYQAQQAADAARQQQLAALLYGARETGLFDAIGDWFGG